MNACVTSGSRRSHSHLHVLSSQILTSTLCLHGLEGIETLTGGVEFGEAAALLFDQVVLDPSTIFGSLEDGFPVGDAFAEEDGVALAWVGRPVLAVKRADTTGVGLDPCDGIRACFEASSHVELQHDRGLGFLC